LTDHPLETLSKPSEFDAFRKTQLQWVTDFFVIKAVENKQSSVSQVGYIITKKVGKAVVRNKIKRQLREGLRQELRSKLHPQFNYLFIARSKSKSQDYGLLVRSTSWGLKHLSRLISQKENARND